MKGRSKILQERAASGRAGLIYQDIGDNAVLQPDGFHVLAADIENKRSVLHIFFRGSRMSHCFHCMVFRLKSVCKKLFPVPGGSRCENMQPESFFPVAVPHFNQGSLRHIQGRAFIWRIKRIQDFLFFINQYKFRCCTSGVNSKVSVYIFSSGRFFPYARSFFVSAFEFFSFSV